MRLTRQLFGLFLLLREQQKRTGHERKRREPAREQENVRRERPQEDADRARRDEAPDPSGACASALQRFASCAGMEARL